MPLPNFICVGAQKAGTTTLHDILIQHPEIYLPEIKETKFFFDISMYKKGLKFYEREYFNNYKGEKVVGEIDPEYMYFEYVPDRIYKQLGKDIKLIFMLRNPVDRAYSHYWMNYRRGYETESFEKAIELEPKRLKINEFHKNHFSYIDRGLYAKQIKRFLKFFPIENMFFIIFDDEFLKDRKKAILRLLEFLEVEKNINLNLNVRSNAASTYKYKFLQRILYKPNPLKKQISRMLIPHRKIRSKIFSLLDQFNRKPFKYEKLNENLRKKMMYKFFIKDILDLENIIGRKLYTWYK